MCTNIATKVSIAGSAKTDAGWFAVDDVCMSYDHASVLSAEHALRLDVFERAGAGRGHFALEIDFASGKRLLAELAEVIAAAERGGVAE